MVIEGGNRTKDNDKRENNYRRRKFLNPEAVVYYRVSCSYKTGNNCGGKYEMPGTLPKK